MEHHFHGGTDRVRCSYFVSAREHLLQTARVLIRITHGPEGGAGEPSFPSHQAVQKAVKRVLLITRMDRHRDVDRHGPRLPIR